MNHNIVAIIFVYLFRAFGVLLICNGVRSFVDLLFTDQNKRNQIMFSLFSGLMIMSLAI